jgi:cyclase
MKSIRIIARLDIKGPNLVKGIHLEGLRVMGKPEYFARHYYEQGADELIYMDVVASLYGRNSLVDIIARTAKDIFIPLTVGGGLRTLEDIKTVLRAGADKVSLNTAAIRNPKLIEEAAKRFGSSTIVVAIEVIKPEGRYLCFTENGREFTGRDAFEWAVEAYERGAGEILLTSVDREGTGMGFDIELTRRIAEAVPIPVIAHGGAGELKHVRDVIVEGRADAVALASILHYDLIEKHRMLDADYTREGNIEFLKNGTTFSRIKPVSLPEIKEYLVNHELECRHPLRKTRAVA